MVLQINIPAVDVRLSLCMSVHFYYIYCYLAVEKSRVFCQNKKCKQIKKSWTRKLSVFQFSFLNDFTYFLELRNFYDTVTRRCLFSLKFCANKLMFKVLRSTDIWKSNANSRDLGISFTNYLPWEIYIFYTSVISKLSATDN